MKICNSEAMKKIKALEAQKRQLAFKEERRSRISYREGEERRPTGYDYAKTREEFAAIDREIRRIKHALALANCTAKVEGFDMTIGEALVCLAQYNAEYERLDELSGCDKLSRRITSNGVLEYTESLFDPEEAERDQESLYSTILKLQVAIDRANFNTTIEI